MTDVRDHLTTLARRNARAYARNGSVRAVMLVGSLSRGRPTRYSDIDTIIIYRSLPTDVELEGAAKRNRGERRRVLGRDTEGVLEHYFVDGVECQFSHGLETWYRRQFADVLGKHSLDEIAHTVMSGLTDAIPLHGKHFLDRIQRRLADYPDGLAVKMIEEHARRMPPRDEIRVRIMKPDSLIRFHEALVRMQKNVLGVLLGLNRMYLPGELKKIDRLVSRMEHRPPRLFRRLIGLHARSPREALDEISTLYLETLDLVERHEPGIDVAGARERFTRRLRPFRFDRVQRRGPRS